MPIKFILSVLFVLWHCQSQAQSDSIFQQKHFRLSLLSGIQSENLHWSIAGNLNGENPNIYSELIWKDIIGITSNLDFEWNFWHKFSFYASLFNSQTVSGKVSDSDYSGNNHTNRTFYTYVDANKGYNRSFIPELRYCIYSGKIFQFNFAVGYIFQKQRLYLLHDEENPLIPDLNSNYSILWKGIRIGTYFRIRLSPRIKLGYIFRYNQLDYSANANWNLITDFKHPDSFSHTANGYKLSNSFGVDYLLYSKLQITLASSYFYAHTGYGIDELHLTSGENPQTRLNEVINFGYNLSIGIGYSF
ncbi:MAG: hypothetical protein Q8928_14385 [Bacteroidota bacterium]|nr:hypothetical protein [Bacteroidota bacterium]